MALRSLVYGIALITALLYITSVVTAAPLLLHHVEEITTPQAPTLRRRQSSFEPVTGVTEFGVQPRLEIRQLEQNVDQWNLYLLGLARFQAANQSDKLSYYQISGMIRHYRSATHR